MIDGNVIKDILQITELDFYIYTTFTYDIIGAPHLNMLGCGQIIGMRTKKAEMILDSKITKPYLPIAQHVTSVCYLDFERTSVQKQSCR
jgi:hypothetical protein